MLLWIILTFFVFQIYLLPSDLTCILTLLGPKWTPLETIIAFELYFIPSYVINEWEVQCCRYLAVDMATDGTMGAELSHRVEERSKVLGT